MRMRKAPGNGNGDEVATEERLPKDVEGGQIKIRAKGGKKAESIVIPAIQTSVLEIEIVGTSPLIVNNFSEKSKADILRKQVEGAGRRKEKKDVYECFKGSLYLMPGKHFPPKKMEAVTNDQKLGDSIPFMKDTFGIPTPAFKNAMISACRFLDIPMTLVTGALHVSGFLTPVKYDKLYMREDVVRVGNFPNKVADIRHRGMFTDWSTKLRILYNARIFNAAQIANLLENAGFHVGVCEWRPEKKGQFGMFAVKRG